MQTKIEDCREKIMTYLNLLEELPAGPCLTIYYRKIVVKPLALAMGI